LKKKNLPREERSFSDFHVYANLGEWATRKEMKKSKPQKIETEKPYMVKRGGGKKTSYSRLATSFGNKLTHQAR